MACSAVKNNPRITVREKPRWAPNQRSFNNDIWTQVIDAPLDNRTIVFSNGTSKGLMTANPAGGQIDPVSTLGLSEE